uniref:Uncharacterized protein n=1 Tax=Rhizophora mucronata TaxID=61149 RepID=A0A2P2NAF5_RHIMU
MYGNSISCIRVHTISTGLGGKIICRLSLPMMGFLQS